MCALAVIVFEATHIGGDVVGGDPGLVPVLDAPIYGRVTVLEKFRPQGGVQDMLFVFTERYKCVKLGRGMCGLW